MIYINNVLIQFQWQLFIGLEILGFLSLLLFGYTRYKLRRVQLSKGFLLSFLLLTVFEAILAWYVFAITGEIGAFQVIVSLFILYAATFGYRDFKKLDRWMRKKIDEDTLLTEYDYQEIEKQKDPRYQAKYYALTWSAHLLTFLSVQVVFFGLSGNDFQASIRYLTDPSWFGSDSYSTTPYNNQTFHSISMIWGIILVVDTIIASTYVFQNKAKKEKRI